MYAQGADALSDSLSFASKVRSFRAIQFLSSKFLIYDSTHDLHHCISRIYYANSGVICRFMKLKVQMYSQIHQALCVRFGISELSIILSPFEATQEDHQSQFQFYSLSLLIAPFQAFPSSSNLALSPHKVLQFINALLALQ